MMSFLTNTITRSAPRSSTFRAIAIAANRPFHITSCRTALSESDHSRHDSEDRPGEIEFHKNEQLKKQKEGKGHWTKELSSNSEAALKADREGVDSVAEDIARLQKETSEAVKPEK